MSKRYNIENFFVRYKIFLLLTRTLLLLLILLWVLYHIFPSVEQWISDIHDSIGTNTRHLKNFVYENNYKVVIEDRDPGVSVKEYYDNLNRVDNSMMKKQQNKHLDRRGNVRSDGYHYMLPSNYSWRNGKLVF